MEFDQRGYRGHFGEIIKEIFELDLQNDLAQIPNLQDTVKLHLKQLPGIGDPLPPPWIQIRNDLLAERGQYISFERFRQICAGYDITDSSVVRTLSGYYSRIGVFTHYIDDPVLTERIYLNSNWLVNTVYEVLDHETVKKKMGRLKESDIEAIWQKQELDFEIDRLTQLMDKFGLMYHIPDSEEYVVPAHLPAEQPYDVWVHEGEPAVLHFIYEFDKYMPRGLMSRLIVSLNHYIADHSRVWHRGFNIELDNTQAEIKETYGAVNTFYIRIAGSNNIELLSIIRDRFAEVLKPFKNLNYKQLVPCPCDECAVKPVPGFHDYQKVLNLRDKGKTGSQCPEGEIVDIRELLKITEHDREKVALDDSDMVTKLAEPKTRKIIELFLASSSELEEDRKQVEIFIRRENDKLSNKGIYLKLNLWEDFIDAMARTRLQDEYNKAVAQSDIVLCLFATKVGKYTEEEFEVAYRNFKEKGKPQYIYTYFKIVGVEDISEIDLEDLTSLKNFQSKLKELGHYPTSYESSKDLQRQLKNQLDKILPEM